MLLFRVRAAIPALEALPGDYVHINTELNLVSVIRPADRADALSCVAASLNDLEAIRCPVRPAAAAALLLSLQSPRPSQLQPHPTALRPAASA